MTLLLSFLGVFEVKSLLSRNQLGFAAIRAYERPSGCCWEFGNVLKGWRMKMAEGSLMEGSMTGIG